ncbi:hypothetical protein D3C87_1724110 [compost metagenome]
MADRLAIDQQLAGIGWLRTGNDLDERALAAAVLSHKVVDLAGFDRKADTLQSANAAEAFLDVANFQIGNRGFRDLAAFIRRAGFVLELHGTVLTKKNVARCTASQIAIDPWRR